MASNYISKTFTTIEQPTTAKKLAARFEGMLKNVSKMIEHDGPIYHTWIMFQMGISSEPVVFNTDTTNPTQNVIANLDIQKSGADAANSFKLNIYIDPFNHGQESRNAIERLDEYLAKAMSYDMDGTNNLLGYLQYGYATTYNDVDVVSPKYEFILTECKNNINVASGITNYSFEGTCVLAADCNYTTDIGQYPADWQLMQVVEWTIFYHYGDNNHKPKHQTADCMENDYKYRIDIPDELWKENESLTVGDVNDGKPLTAQTKINPITYVSNLLSKFNLTKSEIDSGKYENQEEMDVSSRPRYSWYITETDGVRTWHLTHINPTISSDKTSAYSNNEVNPLIDYDFSWSLQDGRNLVVNWSPSVDTKIYIIRKAIYNRFKRNQGINNLDFSDDPEFEKIIQNAVEQDLISEDSNLINEYFDAELTLVGIPADPPIGCRIRVQPRILESVSRTAGTFLVTSASDNISTSGKYTTTLQLQRIDDYEGSWEAIMKKSKQTVQNNEDTTTVNSTPKSNSNNSGGTAMHSMLQSASQAIQIPPIKLPPVGTKK